MEYLTVVLLLENTTLIECNRYIKGKNLEKLLERAKFLKKIGKQKPPIKKSPSNRSHTFCKKVEAATFIQENMIFRIQEKPSHRSFLWFKISQKLQMLSKIAGTVF